MFRGASDAPGKLVGRGLPQLGLIRRVDARDIQGKPGWTTQGPIRVDPAWTQGSDHQWTTSPESDAGRPNGSVDF